MSQRFMIDWSELHGIDFVDLQRAAIFEDGQNDGESDGGFRSRYDHDEEGIDVAVDPLELVGKRHKTEIHGVQHELDGHEDSDDTLPVDKAGDAGAKEDGAENQIPG